MTWPWSRKPARERADASYTDSLTRLLVAQASGQPAADAQGLAVVQAAAALLGRVLGAATVEPANGRTAAITPQWLRTAGRQLALRGEAAYRIRLTGDAQVELDQASTWTVEGRRQWRYRLTLPAPSATFTTGLLPADGVVHLRYHTDANQPWRGLSPVAASSTTAPLGARLEAMLAAEAGGPSGYLLPDESGGGAPPDLGALRGGSALVPTQQRYTTGTANVPRRDWEARRFGFSPPQTIQGLRWDIQQVIMAAHGIPVELLVERAGGGADRRAAWAEFVGSEATAVADSIAGELAAKLETPVRLDLARLIPREPLSQARVIATLVDAGMSLAEATALAAIDDD